MGIAEVEIDATSTGFSPFVTFVSLLVPALVLYYVYDFIQNRRKYEMAANIPGPAPWPLLGNTLTFLGTARTVFHRLDSVKGSYDSIVRFWLGNRLLVFIWDPRDVELILGSQVHLDKAPEYDFFKPWLGQGLLISSGQHWRSHRKLIAPAFHLNVLKSFIGLFNKNARDACTKMITHKDEEFDCHDYMSECTVEILLETAMGVSKSTQDHSGYDYAMAVMKMCNILHLRQLQPWLRYSFLYNLTKYKPLQDKLLNTIHSVTNKVIKEKKKEWATGVKQNLLPEDDASESSAEVSTKKSSARAATTLSFGQAAGLKDDLDVDDDNDIGEKKRMAFLDLMIESAQNGVVMNDNDIKEEVDTIMFEGHDTTAAASSFFMSMMACHPEIQERVTKEIDEIFGDSDRPATFQDTLEMKYLERCLMETLRLYPPVPVVAREIKEDLKLVSGPYTIPANTTVIVATYAIHRDANIYPNPEKFDPDNFLPERSANRHYYGFIPFSAGPRSCVGRKYAMLKLKIILSTIIRRFKIKSTLKEKDFQLQGDIILKRAEGFKVSLEPRKRVTA